MTQLMTMRDVAELARVQRPVVTVWRQRSRESAHPFPLCQERRGGQELFQRDEVVVWLETTGRGNNPDVRSEAAGHPGPVPSDADLAALSALITLRHLRGEPLSTLSTDDDLLDFAEAEDPDDRYLFSEVAAAQGPAALARRADELVAAAWDARAAHARLLGFWLRSAAGPLAQVALGSGARRLLLDLFGPLAGELGQPVVMDATGCLGDLFAEAATGWTQAVVIDGSSPSHRIARRQLVLRDVPHRLVDRAGGDWSVSGPVAHLLVLPAADRPDSTSLDHLDLLDEIVLQADERQLVLCLAPAATLTDPLTGEALARRDQLLRDGRVRAILRLPAGCRRAHPREASGLWLLGDADPAPAAERRTMVADLSDRGLGDLAGLVDDLLAAWQGSEGARRRAWAHLRAVPTHDLVSASGSLTPRLAHHVPAVAVGGADRVVRLRADDAAGRLAGYRLAPLAGQPQFVTVGQAIARGWLRVLPGRRVDPRGLPAGSVAVIDDPRRPLVQAAAVDRLSLLDRADVDFTEPGDVVFTVRPRPAAMVDAEGGNLVVTPARVLRVLKDAPLLPDAIASRINAATLPGWRSWSLATIASPDREMLGEALAELAGHRARLAAELAALDTLTHDLTDAVESGQLSLTKENHGATSL